MTEKEQEILNLYLKDLRKRRIIIVFIIIGIVIIGGIAIRKYLITNNENTMQDENITQEYLTNEIKIENVIEQTEENQTKIEKVTQEENNTEIKKTEVKEESKTKEKDNSGNKQQETKTETVSSKPSNKDFLFTDGYTMENVTQAAQEYLTSSGYSGECTLIKDDEGVYLGMRVIFY